MQIGSSFGAGLFVCDRGRSVAGVLMAVCGIVSEPIVGQAIGISDPVSFELFGIFYA